MRVYAMSTLLSVGLVADLSYSNPTWTMATISPISRNNKLKRRVVLSASIVSYLKRIWIGCVITGNVKVSVTNGSKS